MIDEGTTPANTDPGGPPNRTPPRLRAGNLQCVVQQTPAPEIVPVIWNPPKFTYAPRSQRQESNLHRPRSDHSQPAPGRNRFGLWLIVNSAARTTCRCRRSTIPCPSPQGVWALETSRGHPSSRSPVADNGFSPACGDSLAATVRCLLTHLPIEGPAWRALPYSGRRLGLQPPSQHVLDPATTRPESGKHPAPFPLQGR